MNTPAKQLRKFIYLFLFSMLSFSFGEISSAIEKVKGDQYRYDTDSKILLKQHASNKKNITKNLNLLLTSENNNLSIWSNSFNFAKNENSEVDPRTGTLLVSVKVGMLLSNFGHGPNIDLEINYNSAVRGNPDNLGCGWVWNLTHYNLITHQLSIAGEKNFFLERQNNGRWYPMYHKLKDVIITKQQGHFVITSANGLRDILNSHGYEVRLEQQNGDGVNFSYIPGSNILKKITDDNGHSILLTRKGNYLLITSYDVKGQSVNMRLDLENDEVRNIWFPKNNNQKITDNSRLVHLNYSNNFNDHRLLNNIQYFTGMEKKFTYDCEHDMKSPTIFHHQSFIPVCVIKQTVIIPGANQPPVTINYRYTTTNSNSHNYLGYNSGLTEIPGSKTDILFEAPARYTYQTKEDNGNIQIIRTYNKYHLLIDSQTISDKNNKLLSETQSYFCHTDRSDGCANTIFNQLPVTYSLPLKIITKNWSDNQSAPALTVIERRYNDNGQIINQTDSYGRRTEITYCPHSGDTHCPAEPDSWSTVSLEERIKIFPAPVQQNIFSYPVITAMDYQKEINRNKPGYTLELYKKIIQSGKMQRTETRQYYQDNKNALTYGLLKKKCLTGENLPAGSVKSVIHHYQYILGKNGTEIISGYTDIANNKPVLSSVVEKSLFYPKILRITSADKQNIQTFRYDELGRLTARTDAVGTPFETTTHYQYILSANKNSIIMTTPYGMQKEIVFDGLGRKLATYIEKTDLQGHLHPGLWQQQTQINYNTEGKVTEVTRYMDSGQRKGVPIALTTRFDYDVLGRLLRKHLPDGETEVTKYDNAQRCIIHYTQDIQNNRTTIAIDLNNVTGKPVKHIILPAISGRLPVVTTLCVQGDQLPEARVFRMTYDGFNHLVSTKDTMGKIVQNRYDALGHITDIINPVGDTLHNVYDLTGHIIQHLVLPAKGGQYLLESVGFNAAGQKLWSAKEDGNKTTYHYNINGELSYSYKPNRHHIALYYNAIGLPAKDSLDGKVFLQVNYDHIIHKPLTVTDNTGVTAYHFRDDGLLESATHKSINGYPNTLYTLIYDSYHRLISRTDTHNNKIIYTFDALARPTGKKYQKNKGDIIWIEQLTYDHFSRVIKKVYGSGMVRLLSYDPWGQVRTIKDSINGKSIYTVSFIYDVDGNITRLKRSDDKNHQTVIYYSYDHMDNLVAMNCYGDSILCPHDTTFSNDNLEADPAIIQQHYSFTHLNRIANVTEKLIDTSSAQWHSLHKTMVYHYLNEKVPLRLTCVSTQLNNQQSDIHHFTYDIAGNMTIDSQGNKISYNPFNQILHVVNTRGIVNSYTYDGQGKEVKSVTAQGVRWMIYQERSLSGETVTDKNNNVYNVDYPASEIKIIDNVITDWYESNYKGDVISVLKQDKISGRWTVKQHRVYSPYGMMWSYDKSNEKPLTQQVLNGFNGEITDPATGWQFLGAGHRTYNPSQRYFVSEDPAGDGYAFGNNNPIMNNDPSGNMSKGVGKMFRLFTIIASLGLNTIKNEFSRGVGNALTWVATGLSYGITLGAGLAFMVPAGLVFAATAKPINKGLQMASMVIGGTYAGTLFVFGLLAMGAGLAETVAADAAKILEMASSTTPDSTEWFDALSVIGSDSNDIAANNEMEVSANSLAASSHSEENFYEPQPLSLSTRAVLGCGTCSPAEGGCSHSELNIDTFDINEAKAPRFVINPANTNQVTSFAGAYSKILHEYSDNDFLQTAHTLLEKGGKFYVLLKVTNAGSERFYDYIDNGSKLFTRFYFVYGLKDIETTVRQFGAKVLQGTMRQMVVFEK